MSAPRQFFGQIYAWGEGQSRWMWPDRCLEVLLSAMVYRLIGQASTGEVMEELADTIAARAALPR